MRGSFSTLRVGAMALLLGGGGISTTSEASFVTSSCQDVARTASGAGVATDRPNSLLNRDGNSASPGGGSTPEEESPPVSISEPASALLIGLGLFVSAAVVRRRLRKAE